MKGILSDADVLGQTRVLLHILEGEEWREVWRSLNLAAYSFADFGLSSSASDAVLWHICQKEGVLLLTGNRNKTGADSLEATIQKANSRTSLPVFTIADTEQLMHSAAYAQRTVVRLLEYLIDIDN